MSEAAKIIEQLGGVLVERPKARFLHVNIDRLCAKASIAKPQIYVIPETAPNACAVGLSDYDTAVGVTTGLLTSLDENEIEAVLAHEVGHIQKGHSIAKTKVALKAMALSAGGAVAGDLLLHSDIDFTPDDDDTDDAGSVLIKMFGRALVQAGGDALAGHMLTAASFGSEFEADECGGSLSRKPWALASALARIESLTMEGEKKYHPAVSQLFIVSPAYLNYRTHPPIGTRIERLEAMQSLLPKVAALSTVFCCQCGDKTDSDGKYCYWCGSELDAAAD